MGCLANSLELNQSAKLFRSPHACPTVCRTHLVGIHLPGDTTLSLPLFFQPVVSTLPRNHPHSARKVRGSRLGPLSEHTAFSEAPGKASGARAGSALAGAALPPPAPRERARPAGSSRRRRGPEGGARLALGSCGGGWSGLASGTGAGGDAAAS